MGKKKGGDSLSPPANRCLSECLFPALGLVGDQRVNRVIGQLAAAVEEAELD
jgi:hypothetical protein